MSASLPPLTQSDTLNEALPSLKHLKLLGTDGTVPSQNYSEYYPDTSKTTPVWKKNILDWCKQESYQDYLKIHSYKNVHPATFLPLHTRYSKEEQGQNAVDLLRVKIPSVLHTGDQFKGLLNTENNNNIAANRREDNITPVSKASVDENSNSTKLIVSNILTTPENSNNPKENEESIISKLSPSPSLSISVPMTPPMSPSNNAVLTRGGSFSSPTNTLKLDNNEHSNANYITSSVPNNKNIFNSSSSTSLNKNDFITPIKNIGSVTNIGNSNEKIIQFTPFVSEKLIKTVKENREVYLQTPTKSKIFQQTPNSIPNLIPDVPPSPSTKHKKTNSYKAIQLKKLLDSRDNISPVTPTLINTPLLIRNDSRSSPSPCRTQRIQKKSRSSSPSRQFIMKLSNYSSASSSPSSSRSSSPTRVSTSLNTGNHSHSLAVNSNGSNPIISTTAASLQTHSSRKSHRVCLSCHNTDSPCWRPSWSGKKTEQLCNSCGLRYKKTKTRCLNMDCRKIPTKSELLIMKSNGEVEVTEENGEVKVGLSCLFCNNITETK